MSDQNKRIAVGITGSSGSIYALDFLKRCPHDKYVVISKWGKAVMKDELKLNDPVQDTAPYYKKNFLDSDLTAPLASGRPGGQPPAAWPR